MKRALLISIFIHGLLLGVLFTTLESPLKAPPKELALLSRGGAFSVSVDTLTPNKPHQSKGGLAKVGAHNVRGDFRVGSSKRPQNALGAPQKLRSGAKARLANLAHHSTGGSGSQHTTVIPTTKDAHWVRYTPPNYPEEALINKVEGTVVVLVLSDADGNFLTSKIELSSGDKLLDNAVLEASKSWRSAPVGHPEWIEATVNFILK